MLAFIPLLLAYTTLWSSIVIFRVPIPTPSPALLSSAATPFPLVSLVSVVEEINNAIESLPAASGLVYSSIGNTRPSRYLDASPTISPIPPFLNLPTCVPSDWSPLSDSGYFGTRTCNRVTSTDLVLWDGPFEPPNLPSRFTSMVNGHSPEGIRYFATLVTSGIGFWLVCRLITATILKWSVEVRGNHRCHWSSC